MYQIYSRCRSISLLKKTATVDAKSNSNHSGRRSHIHCHFPEETTTLINTIDICRILIYIYCLYNRLYNYITHLWKQNKVISTCKRQSLLVMSLDSPRQKRFCADPINHVERRMPLDDIHQLVCRFSSSEPCLPKHVLHYIQINDLCIDGKKVPLQYTSKRRESKPTESMNRHL